MYCILPGNLAFFEYHLKTWFHYPVRGLKLGFINQLGHRAGVGGSGMGALGFVPCVCREQLEGCPVMPGQSSSVFSQRLVNITSTGTGRSRCMLCVSQQRAQPGRTHNTHTSRKWGAAAFVWFVLTESRLRLSSCSSARHSNHQYPMATCRAVHLPVFWVNTYLMADCWRVKLLLGR